MNRQGLRRRVRVSPQQEAQKWCVLSEDQDGFKKRFVSQYIGHGIFTTKCFEKGQFLLEYRGDILATTDECDNEFVFNFRHNNVDYRIDASRDECLARWINDDQHPNCIMKKLVFQDGKPHLCLFSLRDLKPNEELRYDYGIKDLPWRKLTTHFKSTAGIAPISDGGTSPDVACKLAAGIPPISDGIIPLKDAFNLATVIPTISDGGSPSEITCNLTGGILPISDGGNSREVTFKPAAGILPISDRGSPPEIACSVRVAGEIPPILDKGSPPEVTFKPTAGIPTILDAGCPPEVTFKPAAGIPPISDRGSPPEIACSVRVAGEIPPSLDKGSPPEVTFKPTAGIPTILDAGFPPEVTFKPAAGIPPISDRGSPPEIACSVRVAGEIPPILDKGSPPEVTFKPTAGIPTILDAGCPPEVTFKPAAGIPPISDRGSPPEIACSLTGGIPPIFDGVSSPEVAFKPAAGISAISEGGSSPEVAFKPASGIPPNSDVDSHLPVDAYFKSAAGILPNSNRHNCSTVSFTDSEENVTSSDEDTDSDTSFKPDEESSEEYVPESSDDDLRPPSPILILGTHRLHKTRDGSRSDGTLQPDSTVNGASTSQDADISLPSCSSSNTLTLGKDCIQETQYGSGSEGTLQPDSTVNGTSTSQNADISLPSCSSNNIKVFVTSNDGKRTYDKPQYCPFCSKPQKKLPRHLTTPLHKDEYQVQKWLATNSKKERERQLTLMRNYGNFLHNAEVLQEGKGELLPVYRPACEVNPHDYLPCQECYGYFSKTDLWKHKCSQKSTEESDEPYNKKKRFGLCKSSRMMLPTTPDVSQRTNEILLRMSSDNTSRVAKGDYLIKKFAEKLTMKVGHSRDQENYIRQRVREISRLVLQYRSMTGNMNAQLTDLIHPQEFVKVTCATRMTAGFNEETHLYTTPSLALKIGHSIKICCEILRGEALMKGDELNEKVCKGFLSLYNLHWEEKVSHHALRTLHDTRRNNPKLLPLTEDVVKFSKYLRNEVTAAQKELETATDPSVERAWKRLNEALLPQIVVFNRKRPGEVSKMTLEDFNKCASGKTSTVDEALTKWERALCRVLWRVEIVGKHGRTVPVLLTTQMKNALDALTSKRSQARISDNNIYLFAHCTGEGHIRACDCLREHTLHCGAKHPEYLRATRLRKQIATVSQIMNLQDNELDILANFMGHDIRTHRQYYRLPESTIQMAKVSKVLLKMEKGDLKGLAGKTLADIEVHPNEEYNTDDSTSESDDSTSEGENDQPIRKRGKERRAQSQEKSVAKKVYTKKPWSWKEKQAVAENLGLYIRTRKLPTMKPIMALLQKEPATFGARTWRNIKDFVRNQIRKSDPMSFMK